MPTPFDKFNLKTAQDSIPDAAAAWLKANAAYYAGDHWQGSLGWSGPMLESDHELYQETFLEIQRGFVSKNVVAETVDRHTAGVIGKEPAWAMTVRRPLAEGEEPTAEEQALIAEAEAVLTEWWDERDAHKTIQDAAATLLWAGRGVLRLFVPPGLLQDGLVQRADLATSIQKLYLHHPEPEQATVALDRRTMQKIGVYLYTEAEQELAELVYLDEERRTVLRIASGEADGQESAPAWVLPLGGRLTIYEMTRPRLITEQVTQQQRLVNLALTMLQRNVVLGGFLERTYLNAQMPGRHEPDPDRPGQTRFVPAPMTVGAGASNFLSGVETEDGQGKVVVATPSVVYRDPVEVDTFKQTKAEAYVCILEEVRQLHAQISGDAAASGESRKQALTDFVQSLADTKSQLEAAIRWLIETLLSMAAQFAGQAGRYDGLRASVTCRLDTGPVSEQDKRMAKELVDAGIISKETARMWVGIDDVDAEGAKVEEEQNAAAQRQTQTMAAAVLNARRQMDSGRASNDLEQPGDEDNTDDNQ